MENVDYGIQNNSGIICHQNIAHMELVDEAAVSDAVLV
jgi:hypothetical protein